MYLIIVGTGAMGQMVRECAGEDETFDRIEMVEPLDGNWPEEKADLIIDFSHPKAIKGIYEYCLKQGGGIHVVMGTTGQTAEEEQLIRMLEKICPLVRKSNFSRGIEAMNELLKKVKNILPAAEIHIEEIHHKKKIDAPSGTAKTLCKTLDEDASRVGSIRMGTVPGTHRVYFALEDEILEITHTAYSKKIFAKGALEVGKTLANSKNTC